MISKHTQDNCGKRGEQLHRFHRKRSLQGAGVRGLGAGAAGQARAAVA